jgi:putative heme degradation protein
MIFEKGEKYAKPDEFQGQARKIVPFFGQRSAGSPERAFDSC